MKRHPNRTREDKLLTTEQLPEITGFSKSYFEKGRIYGYGPAWIQPRGKGTRVYYWLSVVLAWLGVPQNDPEDADDE